MYNFAITGENISEQDFRIDDGIKSNYDWLASWLETSSHHQHLFEVDCSEVHRCESGHIRKGAMNDLQVLNKWMKHMIMTWSTRPCFKHGKQYVLIEGVICHVRSQSYECRKITFVYCMDNTVINCINGNLSRMELPVI